MNCIHLGEQAGEYIGVCCNNIERRRPIYRCQSPNQTAEFCSPKTKSTGFAAIEIAGMRRLAMLASCRVCPFQELVPVVVPPPSVITEPERRIDEIDRDLIADHEGPDE